MNTHHPSNRNAVWCSTPGCDHPVSITAGGPCRCCRATSGIPAPGDPSRSACPSVAR